MDLQFASQQWHVKKKPKLESTEIIQREQQPRETGDVKR